MTKNFWKTTGISMMLLAITAGCAKETEPPQSAKAELAIEKENAITPTNTENNTDIDTDSEKDDSSPSAEAESMKKEDTPNHEEAAEDMDQEPNKVLAAQEGNEFLPGTVQSVSADSMVIAQTTLMGEGEDASLVTLVDEKDAKKITIKFTAETKVEHWTIQGGGAGIDMQEAALSDLAKGQGVEIEGYYEGEDFVAVKILIEEYK